MPFLLTKIIAVYSCAYIITQKKITGPTVVILLSILSARIILGSLSNQGDHYPRSSYPDYLTLHLFSHLGNILHVHVYYTTDRKFLSPTYKRTSAVISVVHRATDNTSNTAIMCNISKPAVVSFTITLFKVFVP